MLSVSLFGSGLIISHRHLSPTPLFVSARRRMKPLLPKWSSSTSIIPMQLPFGVRSRRTVLLCTGPSRSLRSRHNNEHCKYSIWAKNLSWNPRPWTRMLYSGSGSAKQLLVWSQILQFSTGMSLIQIRLLPLKSSTEIKILLYVYEGSSGRILTNTI